MLLLVYQRVNAAAASGGIASQIAAAARSLERMLGYPPMISQAIFYLILSLLFGTPTKTKSNRRYSVKYSRNHVPKWWCKKKHISWICNIFYLKLVSIWFCRKLTWSGQIFTPQEVTLGAAVAEGLRVQSEDLTGAEARTPRACFSLRNGEVGGSPNHYGCFRTQTVTQDLDDLRVAPGLWKPRNVMKVVVPSGNQTSLVGKAPRQP